MQKFGVGDEEFEVFAGGFGAFKELFDFDFISFCFAADLGQECGFAAGGDADGVGGAVCRCFVCAEDAEGLVFVDFTDGARGGGAGGEDFAGSAADAFLDGQELGGVDFACADRETDTKIRVGDTVTEEDIKAKYENGVLSLTIPKKEQQKVNEKKQILIEG